MIRIQKHVLKKQPNFWNHCLFHPTDAVEDAWGKRILDRMADDKAIRAVRIYTMFEDIVYLDENGKLCYDFRVSDLRLDYLIEKGYDLLLAFGGIPDCIASDPNNKSSVSKNKTRYKGKMWNASPPYDYALWEEICYEYTKHLVERYGIERVSNWRMQCFNEPDIRLFFFSQYDGSVENTMTYRFPAYCKLYKAFENSIRRVSDQIMIGGPALAYTKEFLGAFLDYVRQNNLKIDFISLHNYGTNPVAINEGHETIDVRNSTEKQQKYINIIREHGFAHLPIVVDEWGMSAAGYHNREECPALMARENEVFSSYFVKLIYELIHADYEVDMLCICLSGQHEMVEDFSGFRNFFTLNFIAKPIYNAYILASKLREKLLQVNCETPNLFVIPTKNDNNDYAVLLTYSADSFEEDLPASQETLSFTEDVIGKTVTVWCIDKEHTNPYRLYQKMGSETPNVDQITQLREEGRLKPLSKYVADSNELSLTLTANAVYLITVE